VAEKNRTKGASPTVVFRSLAAERRRTVTVLLNAVCPYTIIFYFIFITYFFIADLFKILFAPKTNRRCTWTYNGVGIIFLFLTLHQFPPVPIP
jgi:hypothetical protein